MKKAEIASKRGGGTSRDIENRYYGGKGMRKAVANVNEVIAPRINRANSVRQAEIAPRQGNGRYLYRQIRGSPR